MSTQLRWIAAAVAALAVGQVSAQSYSSDYGYNNGSYGYNNGTSYGYNNGSSYGSSYGYGRTRLVRCESISSRSNFCRADSQGRVYVSRQLSQRQCVQGRNWTYSSRGISVTGGCRADFAVVTRRNSYASDSNYGYNDSRYSNGQSYWNRDGYSRDYGNSNYDYNNDDDYQNDNSGYYYHH